MITCRYCRKELPDNSNFCLYCGKKQRHVELSVTSSNDYNYSLEEQRLLCDVIENYIEIANINNSTLDDYISIIAFLYILRKQYPCYSDSFDKYLSIFEEKGIVKKYFKSNSNIAKIYLTKYEGNLKKADDIIHGFIPGCSNRFINFMIAIGICGKPTDNLRKQLLARAYSWNSYSFAKQAIYYTNLCLNDNKYDTNLLIQNAENYLKIKDYDKALEYYKKALNKSKFDYLYNRIVNVYKKQKKIDDAIIFLKSEKAKYFLNKEMIRTINEELEALNNEKIGIQKHDFNGYNRIEGFWGKFNNYKLKEKEYENLKLKYKNTFDNHIKRLDNISFIIHSGITEENVSQLINCTIEDIENFYKIENFYRELNSFGLSNDYYYSDNYVKGYLLPKNVIIALDKNNFIKEAINICEVAINFNQDDDGTKGKMQGRLERLKKKLNK